MSEYIIDMSNSIYTSQDNLIHFDFSNIHEEIVRCRDCKHYYEAENYHPNGNYVMRCCKYFDAYNDEVEPDGFCKWGERRDDGQAE